MKFNPEKQSLQLVEAASEVALVNGAIIAATTELQKQLAKAQKKERAVRDAITEAMLETGTKKFENDYVKFVLVAPSTRISLDTARIKEELPELYADYSKTSNVKASVRISVK